MSATFKGVVGLFNDPEAVIEAARAAHRQGWRKFDVYTPFPVHGLAEAMEIPRSKIPWVTFVAGLTGATVGFLFQAWTSAIDWPINIGGKPMISWPAFIPVTFEMTILIGGLATAAALFVTCKLPKRHEKPMSLRITDDEFGLFVPATEAGFNKESVMKFLKEAKANDVREIYE
jgi:hypothetical protein